MLRALVILFVVARAAVPAEACVRASEAGTLVGWSADGAYALLMADDHAEIIPTSYAGHVYLVVDDGEGTLRVTKTKVGACASFGDEGAGVIETKRAKFSEAAVLALKTVKAMKFGKDEVAPVAGAALPTATFTGAKRHDVHDLAVTAGGTTTTLPVPVWCVGSCLVDESYKQWTATVAAVHTLANGVVLYEMRLGKVCHGGGLLRLVAAKPAAGKVPKRRCKGVE